MRSRAMLRLDIERVLDELERRTRSVVGLSKATELPSGGIWETGRLVIGANVYIMDGALWMEVHVSGDREVTVGQLDWVKRTFIGAAPAYMPAGERPLRLLGCMEPERDPMPSDLRAHR